MNTMQTIVPHLWFDTEAKEAAEFYVAAFGGDSKVRSVVTLRDTPSGDCDTVSFELWGYQFMAISAGPLFQFNPSISFLLNFDPSVDENAAAELDALWERLSEGGTALMPLQEYPFSKRYGWVQDKYGVTWQLMLTDPSGEPRPKIIPFFLFVGDQCGKAKEATDFYISVFDDAKRGTLVTFPAGMEPEPEGNVMFTDFQLAGQWFAAMESALKEHAFTFSEAISLMVYCDSQEEIDRYFEQLSAVPEAEQCGWLKDKYGVSWQITPRALDEMMRTADPEQLARVTQAFLPMKKLDLATLERAFEGE